MKARLVVGTLLLSCGGSPQAAMPEPLPQHGAPKTYAIHLHRDSRVGARTHIVIDNDDDTVMVTTEGGGQPERKHDHDVVHIDAVATTVAINEDKDQTRAHYDVTDLTKNGKSLFHGPLDVTRAPKKSDAVVLANEKPAGEELRKALGAVLSLALGKGANDDEIMGSIDPQPVGARWPINRDRALLDLAKDEDLHASDAAGTTTLQAATDCCLDIRADIQLMGLSLPSVPGKVDGRMEATMQGIFPIDPARGRLEDHQTFRMTMTMTLDKSGTPVVVKITGTSRTDARFTELR